MILFIYTFFSRVISSNIHRYFDNIFHECKVPKKVITTKTFNVDFQNKFITFWTICFLDFSSYISSSRRAGSTDIPDPLSPLFPIVHRLRQVFWTTFRILT